MIQKCKCCNKEFPTTSEYFTKYTSKNNKFEPGLQFHSTCKKCEFENLQKENWKDGLLKCQICGEYFPEEIFHKIGVNCKKYHYRNNRDNRCPSCKLRQNKKSRSNYSDEMRLNKILHYRLLAARGRSRMKRLPYNLDFDFLNELWNIQKGKCAVSGIDMTFTMDSGRTYSNVSLDQIDPNKGYTKENVQLVCMAVNQLKSDFEIDVIYKICENILKWRKIKAKV